MSSCSSRINPVDFRVRAQEEKIDFDDRIKSEGMIMLGNLSRDDMLMHPFYDPWCTDIPGLETTLCDETKLFLD